MIPVPERPRLGPRSRRNLALVRGCHRSCAGLRGASDRCRRHRGVVWSARTHKGVDYGAPACFRLEVLGANLSLSAFGDLVPMRLMFCKELARGPDVEKDPVEPRNLSARESVGDVEPGRRGGLELALTSLPRLGVRPVGLPRMPESTRGWALRLSDLLGRSAPECDGGGPVAPDHRRGWARGRGSRLQTGTLWDQ